MGISPRVGDLAPDFALLDVKANEAVSLSSLRGKPVLINFWGTWCPPCREEMPIIQTLYEKYAGQVEIVGISMGPRDYPEQVISYIEQYGYTWTFLHDPDMTVMSSYAVQGIPASYFIDKDGVIRSITVGGAPATLLESELLKAITQAPVPVETAIVVEEPPAFTPTSAPVSQVDPPRMPLEEFKLLYDDPAMRPLILDVRSKEAYDEGHIAGAISFPEADVDKRVSELPKDRLIIAYCQ
jgi:peroxiredoxin